MLDHHWKGKLWYAYGTSMTACKGGEYVPVVEKLSGMIVVNKGIAGGSLTPDGYGKGNNKHAVMNLDDGKENADLITLEVLPNEGERLGSIYDTDDESFCGCFNQCIRYLQENTRAQIVVIIMIGTRSRSPEYPSRFLGTTSYFEFASVIERVARLNGVPVINTFTESGLGYARVKSGEYQRDVLHLNKLGGKNMGNFIWSKLQNIPPWEKELKNS